VNDDVRSEAEAESIVVTSFGRAVTF
jgi:hypothetical protein